MYANRLFILIVYSQLRMNTSIHQLINDKMPSISPTSEIFFLITNIYIKDKLYLEYYIF